jgi:hypothetical protein
LNAPAQVGITGHAQGLINGRRPSELEVDPVVAQLVKRAGLGSGTVALVTR